MAPVQAWDAEPTGWTANDNERVYPFDDSDDGSLKEKPRDDEEEEEEDEDDEDDFNFEIRI